MECSKQIQRLLVITVIFLSIINLSCKKNSDNNFEKFDTEFAFPERYHKDTILVFLGGSEGGMPRVDFEKYTNNGYICLSIGYFRTENTPGKLELIPLEYVISAINTFVEKEDLEDKKIVVLGVSKGGELALLLASKYPQIEGVVAIVPSSVVWQHISTEQAGSSWSYKKESVSFLPWAENAYNQPIGDFLGHFHKRLDQIDHHSDALIEVEKINGPILLISGDQDLTWPSTRMCNMIMDRLDEEDFEFWYDHIAYEDAGHIFHEKSNSGGTVEGNYNARIDFPIKLFQFLDMIAN